MDTEEGAKSRDESATAIAAKINNMTDAEVQHEFWKHRILFSTLESIIAKDPPLPGLSPGCLEFLKVILMESRVRDFKRVNSHDYLYSSISEGDELSPEVKQLLNKYIGEEIEARAQAVIKAHLENNPEKSEASLEEVVDFAIKRKVKHQKDEIEIERLTKIRDEELAKYEDALKKLENLLSELMEPSRMKNASEVNSAYLEHLNMKHANLTEKLEKTKAEIAIEENPPQLVEDFEETFKQLQITIGELEKEIADTDKLERQFNALPAEFQQVILEREEVEEEIKAKEWVLKSLEKFEDGKGDESSTSANTSFF